MKKLLLPLLLLFCGQAFAQLEVHKIAPKVWVHTSYNTYQGTQVPSNGLIVATTEGIVLVDAAWGDEQTEELLAWIEENLKQPVKMCIVTHAHDDRLGSAALLQQKGIPVFGSSQTATLAASKGIKLDPTLPMDKALTVGNQKLVAFYPGAGHTADNIVVYLPQQRVLFGGCLVKDAAAKSLGNTADADVSYWPSAIRNVQQRFKKVKTVVPGHGPWSGQEAFANTLRLLEQQQ
ncbi:subclass B1 metallo-beta-lactamase [Pontibacter akesuensis]|uniref:beta-lactamase n=1 Tax=Pontibacter akesuensis TaxID=388950 RepID=A0A1I7HZF7_9BACT|nr:subclass B1 metallo-beta-lactamase [Pontibacter akesuensis]GHA64385.1 beta-lactamase [Pontibacter akesuensis]SFU66083.1 metallo-beta-lactamase class B [Pontibacter akesuensis]